ncbi:MAG: recombinase family protein [Phenylobacterium sp.]|uniref:recombinase family protein n=1 Tax=Phenylobacterium sp. TaxID=1871053 RepID=UPI00273446A6|nr:recombinase family protein [Phenylobacterium sp.]MDP3174806.1 recombinase family protein [Phenylobacterium sp.]
MGQRPDKLRCAIYTRKSSEEGLEQGFNSLHAQREACEAYISSQVGEGWTLVRGEYDDGGFSGGNIERPALRRLLDDVERGLVDTVVVYKVDRLTRSLSDFAKIVDVLDRAGCAFVSITQAFNTTTSMGRLTLNVLLSFAQFEREVTGERIRDKIAQSKAKGLWMGGVLPLGYDAKDHVLIVNPAEAEIVRMIFRRYLELRSVYALATELRAQGVRSKAWTTRAGKQVGGAVFERGALYYLLQNRHYRGEIMHKDQAHPGLHPAIVDEELFAAVQAQIAENRTDRSTRADAKGGTLRGLIFDASGSPYTPTFSRGRGGRTYRYYLRSVGASGTPIRIAAEPLESFVLAEVGRIADRPVPERDLAPWLHRVEVRPEGVHIVLSVRRLFGRDHPELAVDALQARLSAGERAVLDPDGEGVRVSLPMQLRFRGGRTWLSKGEAARHASKPNVALIRGLREAHRVLERLHAGPFGRSTQLTIAPTTTYETRLLRLAYLAPDIQHDILAGRVSAGVTLKQMLDGDVPLDWPAQRRWLQSL